MRSVDKTSKTADLHVHTIASDGAYSVREVLEQARKVNLSAIAITDHDSVEALPEAFALSSRYGIEIVPGIEISVDLDNNELHLLGYYVDYLDRGFLARIARLRENRRERAGLILRKLEEMGCLLDMKKLLPGQMSGSIGRLHIAQALLKAGYVAGIGEAFQKYIGNQGPAYVPKLKLGRKQAVDMILQAGGVPVLAHPGSLDRDDLIPELLELGLAGLEAYYPTHSKFQTNHYRELALHYGLLVTGGSDCHGPNKEKVLMGTVKVPYGIVGRLKERSGRQKDGD